MMACSSCDVTHPWCHQESPAALFLFTLEKQDDGNFRLSDDADALQLRHVSFARPQSIQMSLSSPIHVTAGSDVNVAVELADAGNRSVLDTAVLSASVLFVTKIGNDGSESRSAFYEGSSALYNLKHFKAEKVLLHFENLSLGGVLATYYRDATFTSPFASGVQEKPSLGAATNIIPYANSFRWKWFMRASLNGG